MKGNEGQIDYCILCDGVQGPDHVHICAYCGGVVDPAHLRSVGNDEEPRRVYCGPYCHIMAEPDGEYARAIPADKKDKMVRREELLHAQKVLRRQCIEEGVPWIH
jgi:hypothetical protein